MRKMDTLFTNLKDNCRINCIYLLNEIVMVSVELAQGHSASGLRPLASNALRNESHAESDPVQNKMKFSIYMHMYKFGRRKIR